MKSLFAKSVVVLCLVLARPARAAPGRLGTIDRYLPEPTDDKSHTTESEGFTWDYFDDDVVDVTANYESHHTTGSDDVTRGNDTATDRDVRPDGVPLEKLVAHIDLLAGQDGTTKGQYVYTNKAGDSVTVVYVAGPSSTIAAYTAAEAK